VNALDDGGGGPLEHLEEGLGVEADPEGQTISGAKTAISRQDKSGSLAFFSEVSPSMVRWNSQIR